MVAPHCLRATPEQHVQENKVLFCITLCYLNWFIHCIINKQYANSKTINIVKLGSVDGIAERVDILEFV